MSTLLARRLIDDFKTVPVNLSFTLGWGADNLLSRVCTVGSLYSHSYVRIDDTMEFK